MPYNSDPYKCRDAKTKSIYYRLGLSLNQSLNLVKSAKEDVAPNSGFLRKLTELEQSVSDKN